MTRCFPILIDAALLDFDSLNLNHLQLGLHKSHSLAWQCCKTFVPRRVAHGYVLSSPHHCEYRVMSELCWLSVVRIVPSVITSVLVYNS